MEETEIKRKYLHIAMYRAMDCLYGETENPQEILDIFLIDANPYIWADHATADPAVQADFDRSMNRQNIGEEVNAETAYNAVKNFLAEQNIHFAELFKDISLDEWKELCDIVTAEEESRQ